jgi:diguanylate cyclase (GGDEF)-like protein
LLVDALAVLLAAVGVAAILLFALAMRLRRGSRELAEALVAADVSRQEALVLLSVAEAVNSSLSLEDIVEVALSRSVELIGAPAGAFYMARSGEVELTREAAVQLAHKANGGRRPIDREPARTALTSQRATVVALPPSQAPAFASAGHPTHALVVPIRRGDQLMGALELYFEGDPRPNQSVIDLLHGIAAQTATAIRHAQLYRAQEETSFTDELTRLPNRRYLGQRFLQERQRARRSRQPLGLLMLDIDHFKEVNDQHGHLAGDAVLASLAGIIRSTIRESDLAARYGGEEFAVIVHETPLEGAMRLAGRIRSAVESAVFPNDLKLTVSIGVACTNDPEKFDRLFEVADTALYEAKRAGRNQVQTLVEENPSPEPISQ